VASKKSRALRKGEKRSAAIGNEPQGKSSRVQAAAPPAPERPAEPVQRIEGRAEPLPFVVGIGASAGGLEALGAFFEALPGDSGMAFVVITHQHPERASILPELLARRTHMCVEPAQDHQRLEGNHVYVSVPGHNVALLNGVIQLMDIAPGPEVHLPIDYFFRSLARDQEDRALCIVLSGAGMDGTLGLREIKGHGGVAMVQDEGSAHYAGMPHSAAATQLADYVLRPELLAAQVLVYARGRYGYTPPNSSESVDSQLKQALPKIFVLVRNRTGHDFSGYKQSTMERRIERRMRVHQLRQAFDYVRLLQTEPHEVELLFQELLITVTQFFRDPEAYQALQSELIKRLECQPEQASLRVWVPGCSTGEEAYSIAIIAIELAERTDKRLHLQIFATDLDAQAIDVARAGLYPDGIAADVGSARLQRFFVADAKGYRIQKQVRDCVVFATQNILRDPPFTKLDLLSCRNLLIYLNSDLQQRLFPLFHYALKLGGLLWLGTSETATSYPELFATADRKWKLYERRDALTGSVPVFDLRHSTKPLSATRTSEDLALRGASANRSPAGLARGVEQVLLERFAPATLIVSEHGEIAYIYGKTGAFLEPSEGAPRHDLFTMAREGLRLCLQASIRTAAAENREVIHRGVSVKTHTGFQYVTVTVRRIQDPEPLRGLFRVSLAITRNKLAAKSKPTRGKAGATRAHYETELRLARDSLHGTLNELQTSNEELKSANEELQSTNEELQSSNEELETSKEELQALNEELQTLNAELQLKVEELAQVNDDMQNLLNGTDIATLFLDRQLRIKRFTEQARRVVRLIETDVGRPIGDLVPQMRYERLTVDAQLVLDTLMPHETEVQSLDGHWLWVRILPYRTAQNVIDGVVITFVDIDRLKRAEQLAAANAFAESIVQTVREPLVVLDRNLRVVSTNRAFSRLVSLESTDIVGQPLFELAQGVLAQPQLRGLLEAVLNEGRPIEAFEFTLESALLGPRRMQLNARRLEELNAGVAQTAYVLAALSGEPNPSV